MFLDDELTRQEYVDKLIDLANNGKLALSQTPPRIDIAQNDFDDILDNLNAMEESVAEVRL